MGNRKEANMRSLVILQAPKREKSEQTIVKLIGVLPAYYSNQ